jgi:adenylate kinase
VPYLAESKRVIIVGIPGVGKTTLVSKVVELLREKKISVNVSIFGTIMNKKNSIKWKKKKLLQ